MSGIQFESNNAPKTDKPKSWNTQMKRALEIIDEETNQAPLKKFPKKRSMPSAPGSDLIAKKAWLHEKAAESIIPNEEAAKVSPDRIFKGLDPLIVHMCVPCKKFNSERETSELAPGMVQIPLALCTVCRAHLVAQKNMKFYQHDCPSLKKMLNI